MLHITNLRTVAVGISALGLTAAGIATLGGGPAGTSAQAGAAAGRTATAQADTSKLETGRTIRTTLEAAGHDSAFSGPAAATRITDRPARPVRPATAPRRTSPAALPQPAHTSLLTVGVDGPVTAQVTTDDVLKTAGSVVTTARNTVSWAKGTVDRTVRSLPVKATVTTGKGGTDVNASVLGVSAGAHVG